ncbi:SHOCT domain-containing protein [Halorubrum tibetense]|uniref:SHOCT domain-containing protein n=1 Tax=Halorubrum tibetense TaxID=175631 RepID=A0ABD5SCB4_9EURY
MSNALPTFGKLRFLGLLGVLTFGVTALLAVLGLGTAVPVTFVVGFFIVLPVAALLGEDFPLIESTSEPADATTDENPVATLRDRYASGEIGDEEFERRLDRLLETEGVADEIDRRGEARTNEEPTDLESELDL